MIPNHQPTFTGKEFEYLAAAAAKDPDLFLGGEYLKKATAFFQQHYSGALVKLTGSCTRALELSTALLDIQPGDEVILSSFTFVASANAIVQRGGVPVFVDIRPDTLNIDEQLIEAAITPRTKAIMVVHYAGVGCEMDAISAIAKKHNLLLIEDAAHAVDAAYKGKPLGSFGQFNCLSFGSIKNITCGEGGLLVVTDPAYFDKAEIIHDQGTDRYLFNKGKVPFFQWVGSGSNYKMSDATAGLLWVQLQQLQQITAKRLNDWNWYYNELLPLQKAGSIELPQVPEHCGHNAHIFYVKPENGKVRIGMSTYLKGKGIAATHHYIPIHNSVYGKQAGRFTGNDTFTTRESERLLRLPLYYNITRAQQQQVVEAVYAYFNQ